MEDLVVSAVGFPMAGSIDLATPLPSISGRERKRRFDLAMNESRKSLPNAIFGAQGIFWKGCFKADQGRRVRLETHRRLLLDGFRYQQRRMECSDAIKRSYFS
jgi:hypothetical protein